MYSVLSDVEARKITGGGSGGNNYYYKCWTTKGKEYWSDEANTAGCVDSRTGQTVYGKAKQRKK
ncbi:hypothetical protein ACLBW2_19205 [Enterobacteriaceae bacterium C23F]